MCLSVVQGSLDFQSSAHSERILLQSVKSLRWSLGTSML